MAAMTAMRRSSIGPSQRPRRGPPSEQRRPTARSSLNGIAGGVTGPSPSGSRYRVSAYRAALPRRPPRRRWRPASNGGRRRHAARRGSPGAAPARGRRGRRPAGARRAKRPGRAGHLERHAQASSRMPMPPEPDRSQRTADERPRRQGPRRRRERREARVAGTAMARSSRLLRRELGREQERDRHEAGHDGGGGRPTSRTWSRRRPAATAPPCGSRSTQPVEQRARRAPVTASAAARAGPVASNVSGVGDEQRPRRPRAPERIQRTGTRTT